MGSRPSEGRHHGSREGDVTLLLRAWQAGDQSAAEELTHLVYPELHKMARGLLSAERRGHTLQPTALLNEAYLRLAAQDRITWQDRHQFFAIAARMIQRVLVDHARKRTRHKRGGPERNQISIDEVGDLSFERPELLIRLDQALEELERRDPQLASIVRGKFFGGLTGEQIADSMGCSARTVKRQWRIAKAWLFRTLNDPASDRADDRASQPNDPASSLDVPVGA